MPKSSRTFKISGKNACQLCFTDEEDELKYGKLHSHGNIRVHYYCMLFCSALEQRGKHDHQGILGFMPKDIQAEIRRGRRLKCYFCKTYGATLGCSCRKCNRSYHLPCGLKNSVMLQFFGTFATYCKDHRFYQDPIPWKKGAKVLCSICWEDVVPEVSADTLYPPCCKNGWLHKICVQMQALKAGYFFRCPLCNNQTEFNEEMEKFGVYIPEQDAAWETDPGAFTDMNATYSHCDAANCLCPEGRDHDSIDESPWELILCQLCASHGTHIRCSNLKLSKPEWICEVCNPKATPTSPKKTRNKGKRRKVQPTSPRSFRTRSQIHIGESSSQTIPQLPKSPDKESTVPSPTSSHNSHKDEMCQSEPEKQYDIQLPEEDLTKRETDSNSSRSSSPLCIGIKAAPLPAVPNFNDPYRLKKSSSSSSDSDLSDGDRKLLLKCSSPNKNQPDSDSHQNSNPKISFKPSASFVTTTEASTVPHPVKRPYVAQTGTNPFADSDSHQNSNSKISLKRSESFVTTTEPSTVPHPVKRPYIAQTSTSPFADSDSHQNSNSKISLKRSASFVTTTEASTVLHPVKRPYVAQTGTNPFARSSWKNDETAGRSSGTVPGLFGSKTFTGQNNLSKSRLCGPSSSKSDQDIVILSDSDDEIEVLRRNDEEESFSCPEQFTDLEEPTEVMIEDVLCPKEFRGSKECEKFKISSQTELIDLEEPAERLTEKDNEISFTSQTELPNPEHLREENELSRLQPTNLSSSFKEDAVCCKTENVLQDPIQNELGNTHNIPPSTPSKTNSENDKNNNCKSGIKKTKQLSILSFLSPRKKEDYKS